MRGGRLSVTATEAAQPLSMVVKGPVAGLKSHLLLHEAGHCRSIRRKLLTPLAVSASSRANHRSRRWPCVLA
jgi:hypothetical protein